MEEKRILWIRRNARLRREYLYRKGLEGKEKILYEKKRKVKLAISNGKQIPTELQGEAEALKHDEELDDERTATPKTHIDDEYATAGVLDPKILITTSRNPSSRLTAFVKELRLIFPNSQRMNRGNTVISELVEAARSNDMTDIVIVHETRGEPVGLIVSHLPYGPTSYFSLSNCVLRHDINSKHELGHASEAFPHLIFNEFESPLGRRIRDVLRFLFPVPKDDTKRIITFANRSDVISFRHHIYKTTGHKKIELAEVGPRFELKLYRIMLGSIEMTHAENEWVLRPYMNTSKKRKFLS